MPSFLVTGAAGFIGSALVRALLARGDSVRGYDNLSTGRRENLAGLDLDFRHADLLDLDALTAACQGVDFILHQAAIPSVPRSIEDPGGTNRANVDGTLNVLIAARAAGVRRIVFASSSSAYGDTPTLPKHEDMLPQPRSPYAAAKLAGECYMAAFWHAQRVETVSLRYFNIFGPRQDPDSPYSAVLARFITQMLRGEQPTIYGDGEQTRDFTFVANAVHANLLACTAPAAQVCGRIFNIGSGEQQSLNTTYGLLQQITGYPSVPGYAPARAGDVRHSLADISRARRDLGYSVQVDFAAGLRHTVDWYRSRSREAVA